MDNELRNGLPEEASEEKDAVEENTAEAEEAVAETEESVAQAEEIYDEGEAAAAEEKCEDTPEEESDDGVEETSEEITENELCVICGENRKGEDSEYCAECEAAMYKSKIPGLAWISGIAVICVSVFAFVIAALVSAPVIQSIKGDIAAKEKLWYTAYAEYSQVSTYVDEITSIIGTNSPFVMAGRGIDEKMIESYSHARSPLDSIYIAMMTHGETVLEDFKGVKEYVELYDEFYGNYTLMSETIDAMISGAEMNETFAAFEALKGAEGINEVYRNYFLFSAADYYNLGYKEMLKYIEAADAAAKETGKDFSWLYYLEIADKLCQAGEYDLALKYVNVLEENDRNNFRAHDLQMRIAIAKGDTEKAKKIVEEFKADNEAYDTSYALEAGFYRCTGDIEKSKVICEEGLAQNDFSTEIHRQLALLYLLEGDYSKAFEEAFTADSNATYMANYYMDSIGYTPQLDNTIYLCATLCKQNNLMQSTNAVYIDEIITYYESFEPSEQVSAILSGEKTIEQVLTEGVCDLA